MGSLCRLGNVVIRVYANDHLPPHFHVVAPDTEALVLIETLSVFRGTMPSGATGRRVMKWISESRDLIAAEWNRTNPRFPTR